MDSSTTSPEPSGHIKEEPFGAALMRCIHEEGFPLVNIPYDTIQGLKNADRAEAIQLLRGNCPGMPYAMIQKLKKDAPSELAREAALSHRLNAQQMTLLMVLMMT